MAKPPVTPERAVSFLKSINMIRERKGKVKALGVFLKTSGE
jgi:hypothetical protein